MKLRSVYQPYLESFSSNIKNTIYKTTISIIDKEQQMNEAYWGLFKDYLPILTGFLTLASAGVFGYILQDISKARENTATKALKEMLEISEKLKSSKRIKDKQEQKALDGLIESLRIKSFEENLAISKRKNNHFGIEAGKKYIKVLGLASTLMLTVVAIYSAYIGAIVSGNLFNCILIGLAILVILPFANWIKRKWNEKSLAVVSTRKPGVATCILVSSAFIHDSPCMPNLMHQHKSIANSPMIQEHLHVFVGGTVEHIQLQNHTTISPAILHQTGSIL